MTKRLHVVFLLDESGSMSCQKESVVSSFNEYINGLGDIKASVSLYKFDTVFGRSSNVSPVFENRKLKNVPEFTEDDYFPGGCTPLLDAIGQTVNRTAERLKDDAKVLFIVHTDGEENASLEFTTESISDLIKQKEKGNWTFVYLGEGQDAWGNNASMGIANAGNFSSSRRGQTMTVLAAATVTRANDKRGSTQSFYEDAGVEPDAK